MWYVTLQLATHILHFQPGAGGPRAGLNRREKEEARRKELNKMRDEARARRVEEAVSLVGSFSPVSLI